MERFITKKSFGILFFVLIAWRILLGLTAYLSPQLLPYKGDFPYVNFILELSNLPQWIYSHANFDGVHYVIIAQEGYHYAQWSEAFFPMFPILMHIVTRVFHVHAILGGMYVSNFFAVLFFSLFFIYVKQRFSEKLAFQSLLTLLLFPTSYYFITVYSESLFLCFVVSSFLFARNKHWFFAGACVAIASATRVVGIFLIPALAIELFLQQNEITRETSYRQAFDILKNFILKNWLGLIGISLGFIGLSSYMYFLWIRHADPLYFFHIQSEFGSIRQESLVLFPQVIWRYIKILITARPFDFKYYSYFQDIFLSLSTLLILTIGLVKRKYKAKISELVFSFMAFFLPPLTGTFSSMPRYVLVCFPIFFLIPQLLKKRWQFYLYLACSGLLLLLNTVLFMQGNWIA